MNEKRNELIMWAAIEDCAAHANNRGIHSFIAGVEWADKHPVTKGVDLEKHRERLVNITTRVIGAKFCGHINFAVRYVANLVVEYIINEVKQIEDGDKRI